MGDENKIPESIDIVSILGLGVAILITKLGKEVMIATSGVQYSTLQNIYQLVYSQIPANATHIQSIVNATYFNSLSNLQQATNSTIQTLTVLEYLLYFFIGFIIVLAIINRTKR